MTPAAIAKRDRTRILLAFAAVYLVWGSTYLFIKYAIETIPPFMLGATRFLASGALLYAAARWRGGSKPTAKDWRAAAITGVLMLGAGNGAVMWAERTVASGVVALIVSTVPIWIILIEWLRGRRPRATMLLGLALGLVGMVILIGPRAIVGQGHVDEIGTLILIIGSIAWAVGTLVTRRTQRSASPLVFSALQMLSASAAMTLMSLLTRDYASFSLADVSARSIWAWVYLVFGGSIVGYTAYVYLLRVVSAAKAATYAYVNPVIAVLLGWLFASEPIGMRTIVAAAVVLGGVAIITATQSSAPATGEHPVPRTPEPQPQRERTAA